MSVTGAGDRLVVIGQGYVGLPLAMRAVEQGMQVVGLDLDSRKIDGLRAGRSHIDDVTDDDIANALATGRYAATTEFGDIGEFDVAVITVPTPLKFDAPDLSYVEGARGT